MNNINVRSVGAIGKYDEVLKPFVRLMERELHANSEKGDRTGWLSMSADRCMLEIYHHAAKLQKAVKLGNGDQIVESAADIANFSMIMTDLCGALGLAQHTMYMDRDQSNSISYIPKGLLLEALASLRNTGCDISLCEEIELILRDNMRDHWVTFGNVLPHPPRHQGFLQPEREVPGYTLDQMKEYGALCAADALRQNK